MYIYINSPFLHMEQIDRAPVTQLGGTMLIRIPKPICAILGIKKGTHMDIYKDGDTIIYRKGCE